MAKRKTFSVEELKNQVNAYLLNSVDTVRDARRGQIIVLESVLHSTGNYNGFKYLSARDMKNSEWGTTVGVNSYANDEELKKMQEDKTLFKDTDNTRVYYY